MARGFLVKRFFRLGRFSLSVGVCGGERRLDGTGNFAFLGVAEVWWWQVSNTLAAQQPVFFGATSACSRSPGHSERRLLIECVAHGFLLTLGVASFFQAFALRVACIFLVPADERRTETIPRGFKR